MKIAVSNLENDIENILMERINDKENRDAYDRMLDKKKSQIQDYKTKIYELKNIEKTVKRRKKEIKESIDILDGIIAEGAISNVNLRLLVNEIIIIEMEDGNLAIIVSMNAPFDQYGEVFDENGNVKLRHNGNYKEISLQEVSA